jgi:hypothetical protein
MPQSGCGFNTLALSVPRWLPSSASHFNRDHVRAFGASPAKDVARLRAAVVRTSSGAMTPQEASSAQGTSTSEPDLLR